MTDRTDGGDVPALRQRLYSLLHDRRSTASSVVHEVLHSSKTFGCQPSNRRYVHNSIQAPCALVFQACTYGYSCPRIPSLRVSNVSFDRTLRRTRDYSSLRHIFIDRYCPRYGRPGSEHRFDRGDLWDEGAPGCFLASTRKCTQLYKNRSLPALLSQTSTIPTSFLRVIFVERLRTPSPSSSS